MLKGSNICLIGIYDHSTCSASFTQALINGHMSLKLKIQILLVY